MQRPAGLSAQAGPELTVIAPSFNEAENVVPLIEKLTDALDGVHWEVIFVDDDSPDGTSERVREQARLNSRVRCVQRLGRREGEPSPPGLLRRIFHDQPPLWPNAVGNQA